MPEYPGRLHHRVPNWVHSGAKFHIRLRTHASIDRPLLDPPVACSILKSAKDYHDRQLWWCSILLLMPDHIHAILAFSAESRMSETIGQWKRAQNRVLGIRWQENYFDHRIRDAKDASRVWNYIRSNPVESGLCDSEDRWPWVITSAWEQDA